MTEEEIKEAKAFYDSEYRGAPLHDVITFRCTKTLGNWLRSKAMVEKKEVSAIIRRLLTISGEKEGYDRNGIF